MPGVTRRSPRRSGSKAPRRCRISAAGRGQRAVLTRSLQKGTCDVVAMHHGETENPVGMSRASKTGCCSVLSSCRAIGSQLLVLINSGQQSYDEAIKLFEPYRFLVEGQQFLVKLLGAARQTGQGYFKLHSNSS